MPNLITSRQRADAEAMDRALTLCQGSFLAAAKLLNETPSAFRGRVYRNPTLHTKWGHEKGRGVRLGFHIEPYQDNEREERQFGHLNCVQRLVEYLSLEEKQQLLTWLQERCSAVS